ncbi:Hsp70 family protein [Mycobacterium sp. AZCC_0083]|uniref:Hsp70 family protein n=1 Tax=Mycobacterium sp. AZCC_0083 TaxID=2735882 RepID=UPI0035CB2580
MSGRADLDLVWVLAVDFGTTATAAAVREPDGRVAGLVLPDGTSTMPSSVLADPNGVLVGTKADSAAGYSLDRYQPTPKRDIGRASVLLGDAEFRPCTLIAAVYAAIIREAVRQHNHRPPEQLVLTHPVDWSDRRLDVLREAVSMAADQLEISLPDPTFMPEPVAAATHYAQASDQPTARIITTSAGSAVVPSEEVVGDEYFAVYDLGGGTFDVTVLCRSSDGFEILATGGIDPLGGFEFDNRLFNYLGQTHYKKADPKLWQALDYPDPEDPDSGMRRRMLDTTVRQVKEELSEHTQRTVRLPGLPEPVLVTRTEFENLIRTDLDATIAEFEATLARAGLTPDQLAGIYRIGGASRIPLVGSLLDQIERPVHVVDHPKTVVALGAVVDAAESVEPAVVDEPPTAEQPETQTELLATVPVSADGAGVARKRPLRLIGAVAAVVLIAGAAVTGWLVFGKAKEEPSAPSAAAASDSGDNPNHLSDAEIDLLKLSDWHYNRASCKPAQGGSYVQVSIACVGKPASGAPPAQFFSFASVENLRTFVSAKTKQFDSTNCPGDPPGQDGPARNRTGTEVGRRACYLDKSTDPPTPVTIVTHEKTLVAAIYTWNGPGGAAGLNAWFGHAPDPTSGGLTDDPVDPDNFTPADLDLIARALNNKDPQDCRHLEPPGGDIQANVVCAGGNVNAPTIILAGFTTSAQARTQWDNDFRRFGESCDGQADPTNAAWTVRGSDVGRYTCLTEDSVGTPRAAILAVNEQKAFGAELVVVAPDWPYPTPRNQPELVDWFIKQNEGSFWR